MTTSRMRTSPAGTIVAFLWIVTQSVSAVAQTPPPATSPSPTKHNTAPVPAPVPTAGADNRPTYDPTGRRDPFVSLAQAGALPVTGARPAGPRGLLIAELSVRGVITSQGRFLATVVGPDKRTHTIGNGDQLLDGTVKVISADAVVFLQDVTDPLSPIKQREIRKTIRSTEENR